MRRVTVLLLALATLAPAAGVLVAVSTVPSSAYAMPVFEFSSARGPVRITAEELGAHRNGDGLHIDAKRFDLAIARLQKTFGRPAVPGTYELRPDHRVFLNAGEPGLAVDRVAMRKLVVRALRGSRSNLKVPMRKMPAPVGPPNAIVVNLARFRLDLYRESALTQHFPVGVGALSFPTPPGAYYIRSKAVDPSWRNPGSGWSRGMPAYIPPGPRNPLGTRALRLDRGALVIHGTPQPWSVGHRSSHGCIRMRREDVEKLYDLVAENTPVFIIP